MQCFPGSPGQAERGQGGSVPVPPSTPSSEGRQRNDGGKGSGKDVSGVGLAWFRDACLGCWKDATRCLVLVLAVELRMVLVLCLVVQVFRTYRTLVKSLPRGSNHVLWTSFLPTTTSYVVCCKRCRLYCTCGHSTCFTADSKTVHMAWHG